MQQGTSPCEREPGYVPDLWWCERAGRSQPPGKQACRASGVSPPGCSVTVTSSDTFSGNTFGNWHQGTVTGLKFNDANANGTQNGGDVGLSDWHIRVFNAGGAQVGADVVTDVDGTFSVNLDPGTYRICEVLEAGWSQSAPANSLCQGLLGVAAGGYSVTVTSSDTFSGNNFGNWTTGSVGGLKWEDVNANGTRNAGDDPLAGWTIRAYNAQGGVAGSTTTAGDGTYTFTLNPGTYTICEVNQAGWHQSSPSNTLCQGLAGDVAPGGYSVTVTSLGSITGRDFGNWQEGSITIKKVAVPQDAQDFAFTTTNLGGGFSLDDDGNNANALSNSKSFSGLEPGTTYGVTEGGVTGWKLTALDCTGLGAGDSAVLATGVTTIALKPGQVVSCTYTNTSPDLGVTKSDNPDPVAAGSQLTYTVTVTDHGPANATGVVVKDTLDSNTTFVSTSLGGACSQAAGVVTCDLGNMANGDVTQFTITVTVHANAPVGTDTLNNVVDVSGDQPDWNPSNNHDEEPTSVVRVVDLTLDKSDNGATPVAGGAPFDYTLTIDNAGPSDASVAATVTDVLPAGFVLAAAPPTVNPASGNSCTGAVGDTAFTCTIQASDLQVADGPVVVTLSVKVLANVVPGTYINKAIVTSSDEPTDCTVSLSGISCPGTPPNNYDQEPTPVTTTVDLEIRKTASQPDVGTGLPFSYTLSVNNLGVSDATVDATVVDVLPAGVSFESFATLPSGVACIPPVGRTITCTIPKGLLKVADPPVLITMNVVIPTIPGTVAVINKVIVTSPDDHAPCTVTATDITCNPPDTNNYDDVTVRFTGITIVKDAQPNTVVPFQFTVSGGGLPASFSLVDDGTNANNSRSLTNVVAGQTYTITETQPTDGTYALASVSCTGGGTGSTILARSLATVTLAAGESVVCTFVNGAITPGGVSTGSGPLAFTGSSMGRIFELGSLLMALGLALLAIEVRRKRRHDRLMAARLRIE